MSEAERVAATGRPVFLPQYLYDRAIAEGVIQADDPNWRPVQPIPYNRAILEQEHDR